MNKDSSFFVRMDPPKSYQTRLKERQERITADANRVDETYVQSVQWHDLINEESSEIQSTISTGIERNCYKSEKNGRNTVEELQFAVPDSSSEIGQKKCNANPDEITKSNLKVPLLSPELRKVILIIRLAAASLMFAAAILLGSLSNYSIPLLILSSIVAGIDLFIEGVKDLFSGIWYESCIIVVLVTAGTALAGFQQEAAAYIILYRITVLFTGALKDIICHSAIHQVSIRENVVRDLLAEQFTCEGVDYISVEGIMRRTACSVLIPVIFFAVLYAVFLPVLSYYRISIAIHRSLILIALATPWSLLSAMPVVGRNGLCTAASLGIVFKNARTLESLENTRTIVFDKSGIFNPPKAAILSAQSKRFDYDTLMNLIYHLVYPSEQSFAETIKRSVTYNYDPELINGFEESSGGVKGEIKGMKIVFGTRSFLSSYNLTFPETDMQKDIISYFLFLSDQYAGEVCISSEEYGDISDILHELRIDGVNKCILISEESAEEITSFAEKNGFDEVYASISPEDKDSLLRELFSGNECNSVLVTSDPALSDYSGAVVILAGEQMHQADAVLQPHLFNGLSGILMISKRIRQLATENAMTAFSVKGFLIFLSLIGYCNLWMSVIGETLAVVFTLFNAKRVASRSVLDTFINK